MFRKFAIALFVLCLPMIAFGQVSDDGKPIKVFTDADMVGTYNMKADTVYNLSGFVYVEDGEVLNIEAGTILKGNQGSGAAATALVVAQGGTINATGTPAAPIVMTTIIDDLDDPFDIPFSDARGKWGGLIILGNAPINTTTGVGQIEGIPETEPRGAYGGSDLNDNSGTLQYVSIRHGGSEIGAANEINGLTLGGVGSATTIDHIEVTYNLDDGIEWFGGAVSVNHAVVSFCGDDSFDYDEGWSGSGQFWFTIQASDAGDRGGEHDGGTSPVDGQGFALPAISNATFIGRGPEKGAQRTFEIRDNAGTGYFNSVFAYHGTYAVKVENSDGEPTDSRDRLIEGNVVFGNNIWWAYGGGNEAKDLANGDQFVLDYIFNDASLDNQIGDAGMAGISREPNAGLDPRPFATGTDSTLDRQWVDPASYGYPVAVTGYPNALDFVSHQTFTSVDYQGAFDPDTPISSSWAANWTALDFYGYLGDVAKDRALPVKVVTDADFAGDSANYYWSNDTVYNVSGFVYVDSANMLVVEPGTVVKGNQGSGAAASALIVARTGKLLAQGTQAYPIIMTSIIDDTEDPFDIDLNDARGKWGGLIVLGEAPINTTTGVGQIEGIPETEPRGAYGGSDPEDNSGEINYVSIRHGGSEIGAANEINGLTMGAVGRGTEIDHVEVAYNLDDGFEWFGGTVDANHLIAAFCGDDSFDYDEGWNGSGQFWFTIQASDAGDRGGEHDGGTSPVDGQQFALPAISNATFLGRGPEKGAQRTFEIRDNAGTGYFNSIFAYHGTYAVKVENSDGEPTDSRDRLIEGNVVFGNNIWWAYGGGNEAKDLANGDQFVLDYIFNDASLNNQIGDPALRGVSRIPNAGLDPRPDFDAADSCNAVRGWVDPASYSYPVSVAGYPNALDYNNHQTFQAVDYQGAFDPDVDMTTESWAAGWTVLAKYGYLGDVTTPAVKPVKVVTDADFAGDSANYYWSNDTVYNVSGFVYVDSANMLVVEPGTVVKGNQGSGAAASALIVAQTGKILAQGTQCYPIIMTSIIDDTEDPFDIDLNDARGKWGGLIVLGEAPINTTTGVGQIEGIPETEPRGAYGGSDPEDNSGEVNYVSIRHGGSEIGAANEINGLTMGGVGRGTEISHVEVAFNLDDGFEWFGGTVDADHLVAAFCGDDSYDYDEGWCGTGQFWFTIMADNAGDAGGEHDGGTTPVDGEQFSLPLISNVTYLGRGMDNGGQKAFAIRDNAGGAYMNSIFFDHGQGGDSSFAGITIEDKDSEPTDSRDRLLEGNILFKNNLWFAFGPNDGGAERLCDYFAVADDTSSYVNDTIVYNRIFGNGNDTYYDVAINAIDRTPNAGLFPVPCDVPASWSWADPNAENYPVAVAGYPNALDNVNHADLVDVDYPGAFDPTASAKSDLWVSTWTALDAYGFLGDDPQCGGADCTLRGDMNCDGAVNISDMTYLVSFLFSGGAAPCLAKHGDVNCDGATNISDMTYLVSFLFSGGAAPCPC